MDELEKKKWIVSRTDIVFNVYRQMIKEKEKEFEQFKEYEVKRWKNLEKGIISAIISLSGLIFGINSVDNTILNALGIIIPILVIGFGIYFITLVFRSRNEDIFDELVSSNRASNTWHACYSYLSSCSMKIEEYEVHDFEKLLEYFNSYALISGEISLYITLRKINRSYFRGLFLSYPAIKKISSGRNSLQTLLDLKSEEYEKNKINFEGLSIIKPLLVYGNSLTRYSNGILIAPDPIKRIVMQRKIKKDRVNEKMNQ